MKNILFLCLSICSLQSNARVIEKKTSHELGFHMESSTPQSDFSLHGIGIQYKKWTNPYHAFRFMGSVSVDYHRSNFLQKQYIQNDTSFREFMRNKSTAYNVSVGKEYRKNFYKHVYFSAFADYRFSYATGQSNLGIAKTYNAIHDQLNTTTSISNTGTDYHSIRTGISPGLSAQLVFNRMIIGMETASYIFYSYESTSKVSDFELNVNSMFHRIYLSYRF